MAEETRSAAPEWRDIMPNGTEWITIAIQPLPEEWWWDDLGESKGAYSAVLLQTTVEDFEIRQTRVVLLSIDGASVAPLAEQEEAGFGLKIYHSGKPLHE